MDCAWAVSEMDNSNAAYLKALTPPLQSVHALYSQLTELLIASRIRCFVIGKCDVSPSYATAAVRFSLPALSMFQSLDTISMKNVNCVVSLVIGEKGMIIVNSFKITEDFVPTDIAHFLELIWEKVSRDKAITNFIVFLNQFEMEIRAELEKGIIKKIEQFARPPMDCDVVTE